MTDAFKRRTPSPRGEGGAPKEEILAAAARLLTESGREEAGSLRAVAREVGISAPSVSLRFKDRSEPVAAVTHRAYDKLVAEPREARDREAGGGPRAALRAMAQRYCGFALENPRRYRLKFGLERIAAPRDELPRHPVWLVFEVWHETLSACHGAESAQVDDRQDALLLWSAPHGIVAVAMALPFEADVRGIAQRADDLLDRIVAG